MKVAILAGGFGTRLAEETESKPKPMVEIGNRPILWHIMMHFYHYGLDDFIIGLGYKGNAIKRYMLDYSSLNANLKINFKTGNIKSYGGYIPEWKVELVDTGIKTLTGGRIKRLQSLLGNSTFILAWGDGLSDINMNDLIAFHQSHGKIASLVAVRPPARFGHIEMNGNRVSEFSEKPQTKEGWINGGYFVLEPSVFDYIEDDETQWEKEPLHNLAKDGQLMAYYHESFWQCMDSLRDKNMLNSLWNSGNAPWATWETDN
ncbi:MAG TPA: glucose-1-phosphate cytidylyltransferase [Gammaproteobacteria bacterium]|nr:glucose-1-phosphate cytidylyltransferase [Gammaproteobacteria bacterium]